MTTWSGQSLIFTYYFPALGDVFTGSPISFFADGSSYRSTLANLNPATFSVTSVEQNELQISYSYPMASTLNVQSFNGFTISGPVDDSLIIAALVDPNSTVTDLINSEVGFADNSVTVNLAGDHFSAGSIGSIDVKFCSACARTLHLGDDDSWFLRHLRHGVSSKVKASIHGRLICD